MEQEFENLNENEKLRLLANIATLYYLHNQTQSEIAERLFTSRSKISRLLKEARDKKIVEISIKEPWERLFDIEKEFIDKFKLKDVKIVNVKNAPYDTILQKLGEIAAYYLDELIDKTTILGMSWGNTIYNTVKAIKSSKNIPLTVVQIMGAAQKDNPEIDSIDLAKQFAKVYGGKYHYLYAPLFVKDKSIKEKLIQDPNIADTLSLARNSNIILTSVGVMDLSLNNVTWRNYISSYSLHVLQSNGAVGHIGGHFYDINGNKVYADIEDNFIGIDIDDFLKVPNVVCVAGGIQKAKAILGAIRGGYIKTLITDDTAALRILELIGE